MSGLAYLLHGEGHTITGSDVVQNQQTKALEKLGVRIFFLDRAKSLPEGSILVVTHAISDDDEELVLARKRRQRVVVREELLLEISRKHKNIIAVAGSHGKSTTTAMIGKIFQVAGKKPTIHNGAVLPGSDFGLIVGGREFFITETCEFKRAFLRLYPAVSVITNINAEHMDCYHDLEDVRRTYQVFAGQSGRVFKHSRCENSCEIVGEKFDYGAFGVLEYEAGKYQFRSGSLLVRLGIPGRHNIDNALAAVAVARHFGIGDDEIKEALEGFTGIRRRFEKVGELGDCQIVVDYAHHPKEIITTIKTAKSLYKNFLIVFQPHTYSRTKTLFGEFVEVLGSVDLALYKTYSAREAVLPGGRAEDLAKALGKPMFDVSSNLMRYVLGKTSDYDAVIFVGAGDIDLIAWELLGRAE